MKRLLKQGLALLLTLILVGSILPLQAFAAENDESLAEDLLPQSLHDRIREAASIALDRLAAEETAEAEEQSTAPAKRKPATRGESYTNTPDDGHDHVSVDSEEVQALCEDPGMTSGTYCALCGMTLTGRLEIPAKGHSIWTYDAKVPTFTSVGWEAYEECGRCAYTTYVEIPKLEVPSINNFEVFLMYVTVLEEATSLYVLDNPGKDPLDLMIKYIRTGVERYNSGSWGIMAGYEDAQYAKYVATLEDALNTEIGDPEQMIAISSLKNLELMELPNGQIADIGHMFGTMDITYHNNCGVNHADVGGWAGDLVDLLEFADYSGVTGTVEQMAKEIRDNYLLVAHNLEVGSFSHTDFCGDLDAMAILDTIVAEGYSFDYNDYVGSLMLTIAAYFTEDLSDEDRAAYLLEKRLDGVSNRMEVREAVYKAYTSNKVISTLEGTREFTSADLASLRKATCYAFADYICQLAGDYVEDTENNLYTVFSSTSATLAPGVTQQTKMATNANGKQIVYYLATADLTRDDINLYANYHNNDPTQGWEMQRVLDQANAAEERHSDPTTDLYIENYNVVAAVNGAGFNMSTGEPGGVLVMGGVEYHPITSAGFVGILKDGTPVIGTQEEYNTIYKGQVQEAIACFGARLIQDGKIIEGLDDTLAPRTAIGFTKTGKVVLLVLDGRQEPFSAGGGYATLAQILYEAGCVEAVNLDGGGSTTFVAQMPGDEELSVVNRPSDGFARSVSTSWMLVSTAPSSTTFDHAVVESENDYMTAGVSQQMSAVGISPNGNTVALPEGTSWAVSDESIASITQDGVFTAKADGDVDVYLMLDGAVVGSRTMHIVVPNNLYFKKSNLDTVYGSSAELPVQLVYNNKDILFTADDVIFTLSVAKAGAIDGLNFIANKDENCGIKNVTVVASLAADSTYSASIVVAIYKQGETTFDFEQATGGNRQLAWQRLVSNAETTDGSVYTIVSANEKMETSYILAIDMTQIPIPARLEELTYMLPGNDVEGASAWVFLCQLAERISDLSEIKATVSYNPEMELDISELTLINDYFVLTDVEHDEENCTLTLTLNWIKRSQAIDASTANPLCIVNGIKMIPKDDAQWNSKNALVIENNGAISYKIYMRASALYTFAAKPENQEVFGLYAYMNPNDSYDRGGYFSDTYASFHDSYTLVNELKQGWYHEDNGYCFYVDSNKVTGFYQADGLYYDFGQTGYISTKVPYSGLMLIDGKTYYAKNGELFKGWQSVGEDWYFLDWQTGIGVDGLYPYTIEGVQVTYEFDNGKLLRGVWVRTQKGLQYYYGPFYYKQGWKDIEGERYFFKEYYAMTGVSPVRPAHSVYDTWYEFDDNGKLIGEAKDGLYWYNGNLYYVVDTLSQHTGLYLIDGNYYYFLSNYTAVHSQNRWISNAGNNIPTGTYRFDENGKMLMDTAIVEENGELYYYFQGRRLANAGLVQIDGAIYCIGEGAIAVRNQTLWVERSNGLKPKGVYTFGADGKLEVLNGIHNGIYYVDGAKTNAGVVVENGDYYYAQWGGQIATNCSMWLSNTNGHIPVGTYRIDADGKILLDTAVVEENGTLYYYENGCRVNFPGLVLLDGAYYYVQGASVVTANKTLWVEKNNGLKPKGVYTFGADGKMVIYNGVVGDYYYEEGNKVNAGLVEFEGNYYYTISGGKVVKNTTYWVSVTGGKLPVGTYRFDAEGKMLMDTAIVDENGTLYYYENGRRVNFPGLILLDGAYYYVQSGAIAAANKTLWVEKNNGLKPKGTYTFGADGKMVIYNGIVGDYYYVNGTKVNAGLVEFEGNYYYTISGGKVIKDTSYWVSATNGKLPTGTYRFDAEGKMLMDTAIVDENGTLYYYDNGRRVDFPGLILLDGAYYYVQSASVVATNKTLWVEKNNGLKPKGTYTFGADGKMVIYNGIVGDYYYVNGDKVAAGLVEFEGNYYYTISGGKVIKNTSYWVSATNGKLPVGTYRFDAEGKMLLDTAIVDENGTLYYYENGRRINFPGLILLDGAYYYVQSASVVAANKTLWVEKNNGLLPKGTYTFGADGKLVQ